MSPPFLIVFAPVLMLFEFAQMIVAERRLGVKQIERGIDPRTQELPEPLAFGWSLGIVGTWVWMGGMLTSGFGQGQVVCMLAISFLGYSIRRMCRLRWVLVTLTFECAIRIGMLISLLGYAWRAR